MWVESVHIVKKLNSEADPKVIRISDIINEICERNGIRVIKDPKALNMGTFIIAIGGDGTVLHAMKLELGSCPVLGINLGRVGFLADLDYSKLENRVEFANTMEDILTDPDENLVTTRRSFLELFQTDEGDVFKWVRGYAINEFTFAPRYSDQMIEYQMLIDGFDAGIHRANSVIISSATGSTAYNLSAGGALMMPESDELQITPVAPIKMTSRPLIVPTNHEVIIKVMNPSDFVIRADGQLIDPDECLMTKPFYVRIDTQKTTLCHMKGWNFFDVLMNKLNWEKE